MISGILHGVRRASVGFLESDAFRAAWRLAIVGALVIIPSYLITYSGALLAWQNVLDLVCFAFATCTVVLNRGRILLFYTSPRIGTSHVFSLGLSLLCLGICLSAMSAIHWRASGHIASLNDGGLRVTFRTCYGMGLFCIMLASGEYEVDLSPRRFWRAGATLGFVAVIVSAMLFSDVLRDYLWPKPAIPDWVVLERQQ